MLSAAARDPSTVLGGLHESAAASGMPMQVHALGKSREGRPLVGALLGRGPLCISITAGAHSDEPGGPLAALKLIERLIAENRDEHWSERLTLAICPHVNPDGAARNAALYAPEVTLDTYARNAFRELPGEDVEFCYPGEGSDWEPRPENCAVADFLCAHGPYDLHASLHGMAFAEGAWWLIGKEWVERTAPLRAELTRIFQSFDLGYHDIERHGEKGFTRIGPGFATTPTSTAMRQFFLKQGDEETARRFLTSSMEFVQSLGGDPLVMVSELPLFRMTAGGTLTDPPGPETPFLRFRPRFQEARIRLLEADSGPLRELEREFGVVAFPLDTQALAIVAALLATIRFLEIEKERQA